MNTKSPLPSLSHVFEGSEFVPTSIGDELYAKVFKPGDRVKFSGKIGKNGNVLLNIEKVE